MDCSLEGMINHFLFRVAFGRGIHHSNRKITRMEIDTREQDISMTDVSVLFWEGLWKYLEFSVLRGLLCGRLEAKSTEKDTDN